MKLKGSRCPKKGNRKSLVFVPKTEVLIEVYPTEFLKNYFDHNRYFLYDEYVKII